jgi:hypothetical protein
MFSQGRERPTAPTVDILRQRAPANCQLAKSHTRAQKECKTLVQTARTEKTAITEAHDSNDSSGDDTNSGACQVDNCS